MALDIKKRLHIIITGRAAELLGVLVGFAPVIMAAA
jgi:hypothetical protein